MSKVTKKLYDASRTLNKIASNLNDIETLLSGDSDKILKRLKRKAIGAKLHKLGNKIIRKL